MMPPRVKRILCRIRGHRWQPFTGGPLTPPICAYCGAVAKPIAPSFPLPGPPPAQQALEDGFRRARDDAG